MRFFIYFFIVKVLVTYFRQGLDSLGDALTFVDAGQGVSESKNN